MKSINAQGDLSSSSLNTIINKIFRNAIVVLFCFTCITFNSYAADLNDLAASAEFLGGKEDGSGVNTFYGTLTVPVFKNFNFHAEGAIDYADDKLTGMGIHAYWRYPDFGLLGLIASDSSADFAATDGLPELKNVNGSTTGLEAEAYLGPMTFAFQVGRIQSDLEELDDENFTAADILWSGGKQWYMLGGTREFAGSTSNRFEAGYTIPRGLASISLYGGITNDEFDNQYLGVEYTPFAKAKSNFSFFAEVDNGEDNFDAVYFGVNYKFGPVKNAPLIPIFDQVGGRF